MFVNTDDRDAVEPGLVADQDPLAFGQDGVVRGVPGNPKPFGDPRDRQVLSNKTDQGPGEPGPGDLRPRPCRRFRHVLTPYCTVSYGGFAEYHPVFPNMTYADRLRFTIRCHWLRRP